MVTASVYRARAQRPPVDPEPEALHSYSSLQVQVTGRPAEIARKMADSIPDKDLGPEGRETEPHITCRWGLHFMTPSARLRETLRSFGPITATLGKTSLFSNPDADVLKVDVESPDLHRLYKLIGRVVPVHTTHPTYKPHLTIAYLKPGKGKKYAGDASFVGQKMTFNAVTFSGKKGTREGIPLVSMAPVYRVR